MKTRSEGAEVPYRAVWRGEKTPQAYSQYVEDGFSSTRRHVRQIRGRSSVFMNHPGPVADRAKVLAVRVGLGIAFGAQRAPEQRSDRRTRRFAFVQG
jgi:hypothetical protein